jgi:IS30 family transposase
MTMIDQRPPEVSDRKVPGHWEGDTITGAMNRTAIATMVERTSRMLLLGHSDGKRTAREVGDGVICAFDAVPPHLRLSMTWDQGKEMAEHQRVSQTLDMPVFFCQPHSPWQRPSNENTNGLLRDYFPKGTDLSKHTTADLKRVQDELNNRPRKCLGWRTPAEVFAALQSTPS